MPRAPTGEMQEERKRKREREQFEVTSMETDMQTKSLCNVRLFVDMMSMLNPHWTDNSSLRLQTEDWLKTIAFGPSAIQAGVPAIVDGQPNCSSNEAFKVGRSSARKTRAKP